MIFSYDGENWETLWEGLQMGTTPQGRQIIGGVEKMISYKGDLIVLGGFIQAGNEPASKIASWDGESWSALGGGLSRLSSYPSTSVYEDKLYVFSLLILLVKMRFKMLQNGMAQIGRELEVESINGPFLAPYLKTSSMLDCRSQKGQAIRCW